MNLNIDNMRDASIEEINNANKYIDSISSNTGINFFDLLDNEKYYYDFYFDKSTL